MSGIGSIGSGGMQPPDPLGIFKKTDSDGSGGVSQAELKTLANAIKEKTGKNIDVSSDSFKNYDSNSDGSLSGDELKTVLDNSGFGPPQGMQGMGPPPPPMQQAGDSYNANSGSSEKDMVSELIADLQAVVDKLTGKSDRSSAGPPPGGRQGTPPENASSSSGSSSATQVYDVMDTNKDGTVSSTELMTALKSRDTTDTRQTAASPLRDQIDDLSKLLETLSKYADSRDDGSNSLLSITS